ncbi:retrovirus-related pol polyprotein from transposon TNT 1-94 [Tanacetum coccineum]
MVKPVWNNSQRVNHQNFVKKTHPCAKKILVTRAVLMKYGLVSVYTARQNISKIAVLVNTTRQVNVAHSKTTENVARPMSYLSKIAHSTIKRTIYKNTTFKNNNFNQRVNTVKDNNFNSARPKAVVNAVKGNNFNAVKASACWVWKLKHKVLDHVSKHNSVSITLKKFDYIDAQGRSKHMTGNMSYLTDYEEIDGGYVAFGGNPKGGKITGNGTIKTEHSSKRVLAVKPHNKTLYELFHGRTPTLSFMRPFGCPVTILNTIDHLGKFDGKADEGFFVRSSLNSKAFRVFNSRTRIVEENLHIRFSESTPNVVGSGPDWLFDIDPLTRTMNYEPIVADPKSSHDDGSKPSSDDGKKVDEDQGKDSECKDQEKEDNVNSTNNVNTAGGTQKGTTWVFRNKKDEMGIMIRNKARLVTQGHTQEEGIEYDEVFAPVARIEAIRLFLAYASFKDFVVYQMDVKSAFLYGEIEEVVYVCQPPGFEDPDFPDRVYKPLLKDEDGKEVDVHMYRSMLGSLMYLTSSRRDIMYLKGQLKLGLWYSKDSPFDLVAYTHSDYVGASLDRKSTTGGCQFLGCRLISWQCKKQTVVVNSITEAEYVVASSCRKAKKSVKLMMEMLFRMELELMLFWSTVEAKTINGEEQLHVLVDGKKIIIPESTIRRDLQLADEEGVDCLPNSTIFEQPALMGYEKILQKLTFYKPFFSPQ